MEAEEIWRIISSSVSPLIITNFEYGFWSIFQIKKYFDLIGRRKYNFCRNLFDVLLEFDVPVDF